MILEPVNINDSIALPHVSIHPYPESIIYGDLYIRFNWLIFPVQVTLHGELNEVNTIIDR